MRLQPNLTKSFIFPYKVSATATIPCAFPLSHRASHYKDLSCRRDQFSGGNQNMPVLEDFRRLKKHIHSIDGRLH